MRKIYDVVGNPEGAKRMERLVHDLVRPHPRLDDGAARAALQRESDSIVVPPLDVEEAQQKYAFLPLVVLDTQLIQELPSEVHVLVAFRHDLRFFTRLVDLGTHDLAGFILRTLLICRDDGLDHGIELLLARDFQKLEPRPGHQLVLRAVGAAPFSGNDFHDPLVERLNFVFVVL